LYLRGLLLRGRGRGGKRKRRGRDERDGACFPKYFGPEPPFFVRCEHSVGYTKDEVQTVVAVCAGPRREVTVAVVAVSGLDTHATVKTVPVLTVL